MAAGLHLDNGLGGGSLVRAIVLPTNYTLGILCTDGSSACPQELINLSSSACHWMPAWGDAYVMRVLGNGTSGPERYAGSEGQDSGGQKWVLPLFAQPRLGTGSIIS